MSILDWPFRKKIPRNSDLEKGPQPLMPRRVHKAIAMRFNGKNQEAIKEWVQKTDCPTHPFTFEDSGHKMLLTKDGQTGTLEPGNYLIYSNNKFGIYNEQILFFYQIVED